eukprot:15210941-Alexandrium_andersonii.AAC.1
MAKAHPPQAAVPGVPVLQELDTEARNRVRSRRSCQDVVRHGAGTLAMGKASDAATGAAAWWQVQCPNMLRWRGPGSSCLLYTSDAADDM